MRALVIGGGVAGPLAAIALCKIGLEAVVFEASEKGRHASAGSCLTIATNGLDALGALDLRDQVLNVAFPCRSRSFVGASRTFLGELPIGPSLPDGTTTQAVRRSDFCDVIHRQAVRRGIRMHYNQRFTAADTLADGSVLARFADGSQETGDFLIGADGIHSRVREVIDPAAARPKYAGFGNVGGFSPGNAAEPAPGTCRMFYYERCFFGYVARPGGEICWFANPPFDRELSNHELSLISASEWKRRLVGDYRLDSSPAREIIEGSYGPIAASNQYLMPRIEAWRNNSILIIGDAAHAPASATGQGASLAIEDAVVLALCLRDAPSVSQAFAGYEDLRRPRAERVVALGREANRTKPSAGARHVLTERVLAEVIRRNATEEFWRSQSWLFDHHIDWDERVLAGRLASHEESGT